MKNKIIIILASLFIIASLLAYLQNNARRLSVAENKRLTNNVNILNKNYSSYKTAFGHQAAKVEALIYTQEEMRVYEHDMEARIKELKLKPKNVVSVADIGTSSGVTIVTQIQYVDSAKCFAYSDEFNKVNGCFRGDSVGITIESFDSLTTIVSKIPKHRFLWWTWGLKAIELNIMSKNPNTKFTYLKYIEMK